MTGVRDYQFRELSGAKVGPAGPASPQKYEAPQFSVHRDAAESDAAHKGGTAFHLDSNVSSHLGIAQRQQQQAEAAIGQEIERRWEKMAEQAEVAGYTKGLEEGKKEAFQAELPRIKERLDRFNAVLAEIESMRERIFSANEAFLMGIISQVAGVVALKEISVDPDYVRRLVTNLLHQLGTKDDVKIHLSAADFANAEQLFHALEKEFGKMNTCTIAPSEDIKAGGCRVETRFAVVDASVAAQIQNAVDALKA